MAWLVRDEPNLIIKAIWDFDPPRCSNGTSFFDLDPNGFEDCLNESIKNKDNNY